MYSDRTLVTYSRGHEVASESPLLRGLARWPSGTGSGHRLLVPPRAAGAAALPPWQTVPGSCTSSAGAEICQSADREAGSCVVGASTREAELVVARGFAICSWRLSSLRQSPTAAAGGWHKRRSSQMEVEWGRGSKPVLLGWLLMEKSRSRRHLTDIHCLKGVVSHQIVI